MRLTAELSNPSNVIRLKIPSLTYPVATAVYLTSIFKPITRLPANSNFPFQNQIILNPQNQVTYFYPSACHSYFFLPSSFFLACLLIFFFETSRAEGTACNTYAIALTDLTSTSCLRFSLKDSGERMLTEEKLKGWSDSKVPSFKLS